MPGQYLVVETQPVGLQDTTPNVHPASLVVVGPGGLAADNNFGETARATAGDFVWVDVNGDGVQQPGETIGIGGVPIHLTGTNVMGASVDITLTTDLTGHYLDANLLPGVYTASAPALYGNYVRTSPGTHTTTLTVSSPEDLTLDFGYIAPTGVAVQGLTGTATAQAVTLSWYTLLEEGNVGFSVWRADDAKGPWKRISAQSVPSYGSQGGAYSFTDRNVQADGIYWYRLQSEPSGQLFGPVQVMMPGAIRAKVYLPGLRR